MSQKVCSSDCALIHIKNVEAKKKSKEKKQERADVKKRLLDIKPLAYFLAKAQKACNAFIRERDSGLGCISCGRKNADVWNAGHYISVGANSSLRFNEDNIHSQCARPCNMDKSGNIVEYRKGLLLKIGEERLNFLESWHQPIKMTRESAEQIEQYFLHKLKKLLEKRNEQKRTGNKEY